LSERGSPARALYTLPTSKNPSNPNKGMLELGLPPH